MALPSGLQIIDLGTQGWNAIFTTDMQLLDAKLVNVMTALKILGQATVAANAGSASDPAAQSSSTLTDSSGGAPDQTVTAVSGTGDDTTINNNNADIVRQINYLIAEVTSIRTAVIAAIDYGDSLKTTLNLLLTELRKSTGNGTLAG